MATLAREGFEPAGDVLFAACADEEVGEDFGLSWLCREHPDAVRADYCVNEGGGDRVAVNGRTVYLCSTAEKMSSPFVLRVHGRSGHASMPGIADNALVKAAPLIERLGGIRPKPRLLPETEAFFRALGGVPDPAELPERLERSSRRPRDGRADALPRVSPTIIEAPSKRNVIPALCDGRLRLPSVAGQTQEEAEREIRAALGEGDYELEWIEAVGGTSSPLDTPLWRSDRDRSSRRRSRARSSPRRHRPASRTATSCAKPSGRSRMGSSPCGPWSRSWPRASSTRPTSGSPVEDLELGTRFLLHVVRTLEG